MRLHVVAACFLVSSITLACSSARAEMADASKTLERAPGQSASPRAAKVHALFSPQAQLFIEQKETPAASKTSLRVDSAPRLSQKSKD